MESALQHEIFPSIEVLGEEGFVQFAPHFYTNSKVNNAASQVQVGLSPGDQYRFGNPNLMKTNNIRFKEVLVLQFM